MKRLSYVLAMLLAMMGSASAARLAGAAPLQQATDPASVLTTFEEMIGNPPDIEAATALFADNATLKIIPAPPGSTGSETGKDEIRQGLIAGSAINVHHTLNGTPQVNGNTATAPALVTNAFFQHLGVAPVQFQVTAVVEGGKITAYTAIITPAEGRRVAAAAAAAAQPTQTSGGNQPGMPQTGSGRPDSAGTLGLVASTLVLLGGLLLFAVRLRQRAATPRH